MIRKNRIQQSSPRAAGSRQLGIATGALDRAAALVLIAVCLIANGLVSGVALAAEGGSDREATLKQLRALESAWPGKGVRVSVPASGGAPLRIGDKLNYAFESPSDGYLTAVHVDTHGAATLLYPRSNPEAGRIGAAQRVMLPGSQDSFSLQAQPPVGRDLVYAIVTEAPITRGELGIDSGDVVVSFEPHEAPAFLKRLRSTLDSRASGKGGGIQVAHVTQQVDGRGDVQYRSADIVQYFGERTRSIRPQKLDLQIQFGSNSASLDSKARRNIDEFARALEDPTLAQMRFKVAGHTDATGSMSHNMELSRSRADAVRSYLIQAGIDASRLDIEAHGESELLMTEESEYARQMNRRVEFKPAR